MLELKDVTRRFAVGSWLQRARGRTLEAVSGISFECRRGETLALVGESGCGKSTTARLAAGLIEPTSGTVLYDGREVIGSSAQPALELRRSVQVVFQDTAGALNPRKTIYDILRHPMRLHRIVEENAIPDRCAEMLTSVGLTPAERFLGRYPHQLSGGQRQRVGIARAISLEPTIIIADEPVSALDVSVRAQILVVLRQLQERLGVGYLFITHDLSVVRSIAHRVAVMYLGKIVELGTVEEVFTKPRHPYTIGLLESTPIADPVQAQQRKPAPIKGEVPSPINPPAGCRFHTRCPVAVDACSRIEPALEDDHGVSVACHLVHPLSEDVLREVDAERGS